MARPIATCSTCSGRRRLPAIPVLIYVHGGGFVATTSHTGSPFYDNIMLWAVKNGFVGVNTNYRLAPAIGMACGPEDLAATIQSLRENRRTWRRSRADLSHGTSAGAAHVAGYVSHPELHKVGAAALRARSWFRALRPHGRLTRRSRSPILAPISRYAERSSLRDCPTPRSR